VSSPGTIEAFADTDLFSFTPADGERVHVTVAAGTLSFPEWRMVDAAGQPVAGCATFTFAQRDCGPLAVGASPYAVEVRDNGLNSTGTYTVLVQCTSNGGAAANDAFTIDQGTTFAGAAPGGAAHRTTPNVPIAAGTITGDMPQPH